MEPLTVYRAYSAAWNEKADPERRNRLLAESWADNGVLVDPGMPDGVVGRAALSDYIADTHDDMPGLEILEVADPEFLAGRLRVRWIARQGELEVFTGTDFIELADDGRIARVTMFYDSTPEDDTAPV